MTHTHQHSCSCHGACHAPALPQNYTLKHLLYDNRPLLVAAVLFVLSFLLNAYKPLQFILCLAAWLLAGKEVLLHSIKNIAKGSFLDENFLMTLATLGAFALGQYPEAAAVMIFFQAGETFQEYAAGNSRRSIKALLALRPPFARLQQGSSWHKTEPEQVQPGAVIAVYPGEKIPLDGTVIKGEAFADTSALTGESLPRPLGPGSQALAGFVCKDGELIIRVEKTYKNSASAKILELVESSSSKKAQTEKFISRFARWYTPVVVAAAVLTALVPPLVLADASFKEWIYRALVFLVISCPCALVLSVPLGFFGGIGGAAKNGILIKGGTYLERLANIYTLAFDKTGTLTQGVFEVRSVAPAPGINSQEVLLVAAQAEARSNHPIAKAIAAAGPQTSINEGARLTEHAGEGVEFRAGDTLILAGNEHLLKRFDVTGIEAGNGTCVYIAQNGRYLGRIELGDTPKPGAQKALQELKKCVKQTVILSGDTPEAVQKTAQELAISQAYGGLLPEGKVHQLEALMAAAPEGAVTAFAGDGINDAPVLARADLALAMGALGSDAAVETADVVLMTDELNKIVLAVQIARKTLTVVKQNIVFALTVKVGILALGACGLANMWAAVFADVGVCILAVLNALRPLYFKPKSH